MSALKLVCIVAAVAGSLAVGVPAAWAQGHVPCDSREKILTALSQDYKEAPAGIGLTQTGRVIELLVSRRGSWTLLATGPGGTSCLIAAGENWEALTLPIGEKT
jgi:hypothetical protein